MGQVTHKFFADANAAERAIVGLERKYANLENKIAQVSRRSKRGTEESKRGFLDLDKAIAKSAGTVRNFIAGFAGMATITSAVQVLRREFERLKKAQADAAGEQTSFGDVVRSASRNAGGTLGSAAEVEARIRRIANEAGVGDAKKAGVALGAGLSAAGPTNRAEGEAIAALTTKVLRFAPDLSGEDAGKFTAAAAAVARGDKNVSDEARIGYIQQVANRANVSALKDVVANIAPAVQNLTALGFDSSNAGALVAAQSRGSSDITGASSATAALQLGQQLKDAFPELDPDDALAKIQSDERERRSFLAGANFEVKQKGAIERLLTPGTAEFRDFQAGRASFGNFGNAEAEYNRLLADFDTSPSIRAAQLQRVFETGIQGIRLVDLAGGQKGIARAGLSEALEAAGVSETAAFFKEAGFEFTSGSAPVSDVARRIRGVAVTRAAAEAYGPVGYMGAGFLPESQQQEVIANSSDPRNQALVDLAGKLDQLVNINAQQLDEQRRGKLNPNGNDEGKR